MYRCQICKTIVPPGTPTHKLVARTREKHYPGRGRSEGHRRWNRRGRSLTRYDKGGQGREIVQELMACPECAQRHRDAEPTHEVLSRTDSESEVTRSTSE